MFKSIISNAVVAQTQITAENFEKNLEHFKIAFNKL